MDGEVGTHRRNASSSANCSGDGFRFALTNLTLPIQRVFIIGLSGSGKSTVGRIAARKLGWKTLDTDDLVVREAGMPIDDIFERLGEPEFRRRERAALLTTLGQNHVLVATGAGIVLDSRNRSDMLRSGITVYMKASPERCAAHLMNSKRGEIRPLLEGAEGLENRLRTLLEERAAFYETAHITVNGERERVDQLATDFLSAIAGMGVTAAERRR
ncbi:MAG: shikimate kinase [Gammaproteobacteria bacterium]|nr:shikimate kinase [Gammaproteobacteria bacterium]